MTDPAKFLAGASSPIAAADKPKDPFEALMAATIEAVKSSYKVQYAVIDETKALLKCNSLAIERSSGRSSSPAPFRQLAQQCDLSVNLKRFRFTDKSCRFSASRLQTIAPPDRPVFLYPLCQDR